MKKNLLLLLIVTFSITTVIQAQFKVPQLKEKGYVQDYENLLTQQQKNNLNIQIDSINKKSSIEIAVVILNDLQNHSIEEAGLAIGRSWGVGKKDMKNGIVYLISPQNHQARIEVGYGLEGDLPDITAQKIGDDATHFYKQGNWFNGIKYVITQIGQQLDPIYKLELQQYQKNKEKPGFSTTEFIILVVIILAIILGLFFIILNHKDEKDLEDEEDEEEHGLLHNENSFITSAATGYLAGTLASHSNKDDDDSYSSGSSYSSSSDDDNSSSSSSDFGGFGGGDFGGGGATSSW